MAEAPRALEEAVFVDGCRLPFQRSGTSFVDQSAYDLARMAIAGLISRTRIDRGSIGQVVMGCVIQDVATSNVAREAALAAGIPNHVPAHTVTQACISSNRAIASAVDAIRLGHIDCAVAGGTETLSDIPIRFRKKLRKQMIKARKAKSPADYLKLLRKLRPSDILPEVPEIAEYSTGETMGESADKLAAAWGISRQEQDEYAMRSHHLAARAHDEGLFDQEVIPAFVPPSFDPISSDNGIRADTSMEALAGLKPAFVKPFGSVTAGNASYLTDGASATLLMSRRRAEAEGRPARAVFRDHLFVAQDPGEELLLGPAYAIPRLLERHGLSMADVGVFELHEAFAGQVLAVQEALESREFARRTLGRDQPPGQIPIDRLNLLGGSLSLGHPFGATGARLVTTAVNRMHREDARFAVVAACAAGGLGHAMLLERSDT